MIIIIIVVVVVVVVVESQEWKSIEEFLLLNLSLSIAEILY